MKKESIIELISEYLEEKGLSYDIWMRDNQVLGALLLDMFIAGQGTPIWYKDEKQ